MTLAPAAVVAQSVDNGEPNHVVVGNTGDTALAGADGGQIQPFTTAELEDLVAPVALYPDELLAIVLPAATYPLQIVQAARFLDDLENDDSLQPDEDWDESVVALLNYPEVIDLLNSDLEWTWQLGEAVLNQEEEVIQAVETFRDRALLAGNLVSMIVQRTALSVPDRSLGMLFGFARGIILIGLVVMVAQILQMPDQPWWDDSKLVPYGTAVADWMQQFLDAGVDYIEGTVEF
ncbi:MAG: CvpA family protein [Proteobacteria bacterium]|nr:CvpA family protein [Pseudomonadota bacterium]